jgi:hypothetical protein
MDDGRVLAVELKDVTGNINLGTLGENATGNYGGSIARILSSAARYANSSAEQLKLMSQTIREAASVGKLQNALFASSKATSISAAAQDEFVGVYRVTNDGNVIAEKLMPELKKPDFWAKVGAGWQIVKAFPQMATDFIGRNMFDSLMVVNPKLLMPDPNIL